MVADPGESRNLIGEHPEMKVVVTNCLAGWIQYQNRLMAKLTSVAADRSENADSSAH